LVNDVREIAARVEVARNSCICRSLSGGRSHETRSLDVDASRFTDAPLSEHPVAQASR
jgi:hypothetical protein